MTGSKTRLEKWQRLFEMLLLYREPFALALSRLTGLRDWDGENEELRRLFSRPCSGLKFLEVNGYRVYWVAAEPETTVLSDAVSKVVIAPPNPSCQIEEATPERLVGMMADPELALATIREAVRRSTEHHQQRLTLSTSAGAIASFLCLGLANSSRSTDEEVLEELRGLLPNAQLKVIWQSLPPRGDRDEFKNRRLFPPEVIEAMRNLSLMSDAYKVLLGDSALRELYLESRHARQGDQQPATLFMTTGNFDSEEFVELVWPGVLKLDAC